jgi:hypothetical protein
MEVASPHARASVGMAPGILPMDDIALTRLCKYVNPFVGCDTKPLYTNTLRKFWGYMGYMGYVVREGIPRAIRDRTSPT